MFVRRCARAGSDRARIRQRVLVVTFMKAWRPTRRNWCTPEPALTLAKSSTVTWPPSSPCSDRVVADVAVVRHVRVGHEYVAVANLGDAAAAARPAVDGDELAEDVARPLTTAFFAAELHVRQDHRIEANRIDVSVSSPISVRPSMIVEAPIGNSRRW